MEGLEIVEITFGSHDLKTEGKKEGKRDETKKESKKEKIINETKKESKKDKIIGHLSHNPLRSVVSAVATKVCVCYVLYTFFQHY